MVEDNEKIYLKLMSAPYFDDFDTVENYFHILTKEQRHILLINCSRKNHVKMFINLHQKGYDIHYKSDDLFFFNIGLGNTKIVEYFLNHGSCIENAEHRIFQVAIQGQQLKLLDLFFAKKLLVSQKMLNWFKNYKNYMNIYDYYQEYLDYLEKKINYQYLEQELNKKKEPMAIQKL